MDTQSAKAIGHLGEAPNGEPLDRASETDLDKIKAKMLVATQRAFRALRGCR